MRVKERVELYLNSFSGPSWPVQEWNLHFTRATCSIQIKYEVLCHVILSSLLLNALFSNTVSYLSITYFSHCNINHGNLPPSPSPQRLPSINRSFNYRTADILILGTWPGWRPETVASRNCSIIGVDIKCAYRLPTHRQRPSKKGEPEKWHYDMKWQHLIC